MQVTVHFKVCKLHNVVFQKRASGSLLLPKLYNKVILAFYGHLKFNSLQTSWKVVTYWSTPGSCSLTVGTRILLVWLDFNLSLKIYELLG